MTLRESYLARSVLDDRRFRGPNANPSLHEQTVAEIGGWILGGKYAPNALLPRERELCDILGVSRTTVREAIRVLVAKGMLETRTRVGVCVLPRINWRLLDGEVLSWHPDIGSDSQLLDELLEARRIFEPEAARLAAERANSSDLAEIEKSYNAMAKAMPGSYEDACAADLAFHSAVILASHNLVLINLIDPLRASLRAILAITNRASNAAMESALEEHFELLEAIRLRDPERAVATVHKLLDTASRNTAAARQSTDDQEKMS